MTMYATQSGALIETVHADDNSFVNCASECGSARTFWLTVTPTPVTDAEMWAQTHAASCTRPPISQEATEMTTTISELIAKYANRIGAAVGIEVTDDDRAFGDGAA